MEQLAEIILSVLVGLLTSQLYDGSATLARVLIKMASKRLPNKKAARYREEWFAHLNECEGKLAKLGHALGCLFASHRMHSPLFAYARASWGYMILWGMETALSSAMKLMWTVAVSDAKADKKVAEKYMEMFVGVGLIHAMRKMLFQKARDSLKDDARN